MNKNLLVEIFVPTADGKGAVATGYPIAPGKILTARHVLFPPDPDDKKPIEVRWYHHSGPARIWLPIRSVAWQDSKLDAALLACDFPEGVREWGILSPEKPQDHKPWCSEGFARAGRKEDGSRKPVPLKGACCSMADTATEFVVDVDAATSLPDGWKGASGSPVFVTGRIIGVVKTCPANFNGQRLEATPVWHLLGDLAFCRCLGYDENADRLKQIRGDLAKCLRSCPKAMEFLGRELAVDEQPSNRDLWADDLAKKLADLQIKELVWNLNRAHRMLCEESFDGNSRDGLALVRVASLTMPVLFDAAVIHYTQQQVVGSQIALVSLPVATRTVAEIVMAGMDKRSAQFRSPSAERDFPIGTLCLPAPPEAGIDPGNKEFSKAVLIQLSQQFLSREDRERYRDDKEQLIRLVGIQLEHDLEAYDCRYYFFFDPPGDESSRHIWQAAIDDLKRCYPAIACISLADDASQVREERSLFSSLRDMLWRSAQARSP